MRLRALAAIVLSVLVLPVGEAGARLKTGSVVFKERTCDGYLVTLHKGNSTDYRSAILICFHDTVADEQITARIEVEVARRNGDRFELPTTIYCSPTRPDTSAPGQANSSSSKIVMGKQIPILPKEWALESGDELHVRIYDETTHSHVCERYIPIRKHGLSGNISFPFLSVQRFGDHPGGLGAGISYTGRYVQRERGLLNKLGFGLNFSFLDFEPGQKVEVGIGFVVSFPDDLFQVGVGKNLTVNRDSGYYFLGINLPAVKEKLGL
jgi:hypothetical protein